MSIPTVAVTCIAYDQNGNPVIGGLFRARLDRTETYNGFVVPEQVTGTADANGVVVLQLWPNALGVAGSSYRITAINPDTRQQYLNTTAVVPNSACNLHEIIVAAPFPPVDASEQALIAAQGALALVTAQAGIATNAATQAEGHADNAQNSATAASASALTASNAAQTATTKAGEASTSATNASTSASTAATQATLAQGFANASEASAAAAASSASAANASAGIAITQAGIATNSATEAGNFASVATSAANTATTQAQTATAQAGIATEAAQAALSAANDPNVATVGQNIASVNAVANSISSVNTVASNTANVNTVAGISASVTTVAGNTANINTVAASNTNIDTVANNIGNVNIAGANIASVNLVSESIEDVNTVAAALAEPLSAANAVSYDNTGTVLKATNVQVAINELESYAWTLADNRLRESFRKEKATTIAPSLLLDFQGDKRLDPRITFTRASSARYYDGQTVAKAEENLVLQSQDFTTSWTVAGTNATVTADTTAAPDGTTTADTLTDNATSGVHRVAQSLTTSNTNQMVLSCFAKYSNLQWITLALSTSTGTWAGAKFDVQNGVLGSTSQQGTGFAANSSSITSVGNGWYRCVLVLTPGASGFTVATVSGATDGTTFTTSQRGSEVYSGTGSAVFIWGAQLEQRSSVTAYTPTTTQPITNYVPVLLSAANNVARFDHNPVTGESLGLLIEELRTNLLVRSEEFDNASWTKTNDATVTLNTNIAPSGNLVADSLIESTGNLSKRVLQTATTAASTTHTISVYAKPISGSAQRYLMLSFSSAASTSSYAQVRFDLVAGQSVLTAANGTGLTITSSSITSVGNGWYRCVAVGTIGTNTDMSANIGITQSATTISLGVRGSENYTGDGYSGVYIWGAQLEVGAFPTSYIPTVASQVTRSADVAFISAAAFAPLYNSAESTVYSEASSLGGSGTDTTVGGALFGDGNNRIRFGLTTSSGNFTLSGRLSGDTATRASSQFIAVGQIPMTKFAFAISQNAYPTRAATGVASDAWTTGNTGTLLVAPELRIGSFSAALTQAQNGTIKKIAYYPKRLANDQLQGITT